MDLSDLINSTGRLIVYTLIASVLIAVLPGIPPHIEPRIQEFPAQRELEGVLAPNGALDTAEDFIGKESYGADSIVADGDTIYFGTYGGDIGKYDGTFKKIAQTGEPCNLQWEERKCGLPLGIRMDNDKNLVTTDAVRGLIKINPNTGEKQTIVKIGQMIEGRPVNFPDDLDIAKDGTIYWSEPTDIPPEDGFIETLSGIPSGRLIQTDPKTGESKVLIKDLMFGNGVQLSPNEDFVLIAETVQQRVHRYYLKGEKKGTSDIFVDRLPGFPDNLRSNGKGGFYIPIMFPRDKSVDLLGRYPIVRKLFIRMFALSKNALNFLEYFLPKNELLGRFNVFLRNLIFYVGDPNAKSMVVETDVNGKIIGSLQNDKGSMRMMSQIQVGDKYVYFGSPANPVYRVKRTEIEAAKSAA